MISSLKTDLTKSHSYDTDKVLDVLKSSHNGLSQQEAQKRLDEYGLNKLPEKKDVHPVLKFLKHFHNILIYVLLVAAVITALLGHWIDTWIILVVVVINGLIGYLQEGKAEKALDAVKKMLSSHALVKRDGQMGEIEAEKLVPGDIVQLKSGDRVPADIRLLSVKSFSVNEASLTGESESVQKGIEPVGGSASLGDRFSMAYSGTLVSSGLATGVVTATGAYTELGKINRMLSEVKSITTPLLRQIEKFGRKLTLIILLFAAITFMAGYFIGGYSLEEIFLAVVGLSVAAIPEGLPAVITIILAIGVQRMAKRNSIIRLLPGVETLGSVSVICSDKTGTLTKSEMTVTHVQMPDKMVEISGIGYKPSGHFSVGNKRIDPVKDEMMELLLNGCLLCNDSRLREENDSWTVEGAPTEGALICLANKGGIDSLENSRRLDTIPFESEHKFMATLNETGTEENPSRVIFLKGAPERVLERCQYQGFGDERRDIDTQWWKQRCEEMASKGLRLLAVACKDSEMNRESIDMKAVQDDFSLLAIIGLIDPPREEAISAVQECREAGIRVKMITGDHALTAVSVAKQLGIGDGKTVISGSELDKIDDSQLPDIAERVDVFARVSPEHKLRLVQALQKKGIVTAMTGDGVNDAPALKRADIGIAMGIKGTEASKEAAVMVLADDNFTSIVNAVEEGRTVYDNLRKSLLFILPTNGGQGLIIITAIILGTILPITPAQILWVNMVTAVTLALALAFEPMEKDAMKKPPRDPKSPLISGPMLGRIIYVSVLLNLSSFGLFYFFHNFQPDLGVDYARTIAVNTLIIGEIFYLFNSRFLKGSSLNLKAIKATKPVWITVLLVSLFQLLFTYFPVFQNLFGTSGVRAIHWPLMIASGVVLFIMVELEKALLRRRKSVKNV
ncbi:calcium-transporting P-type ATPase [Chitinispirillum alkaliphilum]|nr:calcium-transporting P-type ATPase [Chitinispirillum alkaliphilum]